MIATSKRQLITTKILPPQCAPGLIDRQRLLDLIAQVQAKQVTVIKAGPGFGKTSLAVAWAERLQKSGKSIAWLTLDTDDDEPTRFLFYVSHALRRASDGVGEAAIDDLLPYFGNLIAGWRELHQPDLTAKPASNVVESLSPRERNILERIGQGRSNKEIARELSIAPETVKSHVKTIFIKLAVDRRAQAVSRAQSLGLVRI